MLKSFADLQADDWIMVFVLLPLTISITLINLVPDSATPKQRIYRYLIEEHNVARQNVSLGALLAYLVCSPLTDLLQASLTETAQWHSAYFGDATCK